MDRDMDVPTSSPLPPTTDNVILIVPSALTPGSFIVCSLAENAPPPRADGSDASSSSPYQLKTHTAAADDIPPDLLKRFFLETTWPHLHGGAIDVIISTGSGAGHALPFWTDVLEPLLALVEANTASQAKDHHHHHRIVVTQDAHTVRSFSHVKWRDAAAAAASPPQTIIVLSGDGGIADLLNGTDGRPPACAVPPTLAVIPLGTANALFHSLHKPLYAAGEASSSSSSSLVLALRTLFAGKEAALPVFRASFSSGARLVHGDSLGRRVDGLTGAVVASYGLHASIIWESDTPEYRQYGSRRFGMVAGELLRQNHAYKARVDVAVSSSSSSTTPQSDTNEHGYVLATLVSNLERTFAISPASRPLDGRLRLVRFGAVDADKTMEIMMAAYQEGAHVDMRWPGRPDGADDGVGYDEVDEVKVTILEEDARWRKVCVDGTVVEIPTGGSMTVRLAETWPFKVLVDESVLRAGSIPFVREKTRFK